VRDKRSEAPGLSSATVPIVPVAEGPARPSIHQPVDPVAR
jgi:hypothetical protein